MDSRRNASSCFARYLERVEWDEYPLSIARRDMVMSHRFDTCSIHSQWQQQAGIS